jgi:hypothetical protein
VAGAIAELAKRAADSITNLITIPAVRRLWPHGMLQRVLGSIHNQSIDAATQKPRTNSHRVAGFFLGSLAKM